VMGGVHTDIRGATEMRGLWAAGEAACVSVHGANRLGSNSTSICLVYGRITGSEAAAYAQAWPGNGVPKEQVLQEERRLFDGTLRGGGDVNPYEVRDRLRSLMDRDAYVFRTGEGLARALREIRSLEKEAYRNVGDPEKEYNTNFLHVLELDSLLTAAEIVVTSALAREESRGAHTRLDHPKRDDVRWLKHTLARRTAQGPRLEYVPVTITKHQPVERKY